MYYSSHDQARNLLVSRLVVGGDELADFPLHLDRMLEACRVARPSKPAILVLLDRGHALPDANTRKRIATVSGRADFEPHLAIVSQNPMLRGVLTAVSWLRRAHYSDTIVSSVDEAIRWLEVERGEGLPELRSMLMEVERQARPDDVQRSG